MRNDTVVSGVVSALAMRSVHISDVLHVRLGCKVLALCNQLVGSTCELATMPTPEHRRGPLAHECEANLANSAAQVVDLHEGLDEPDGNNELIDLRHRILDPSGVYEPGEGFIGEFRIPIPAIGEDGSRQEVEMSAGRLDAAAFRIEVFDKTGKIYKLKRPCTEGCEATS